MNCIDKEKSIKKDITSIENRVRHAFNQGYDLGFKDGKEKAKSQEPVLEKIRAEIDQHRRKTQSIDPYDLLGDCLDIIDKYKTESEDKE